MSDPSTDPQELDLLDEEDRFAPRAWIDLHKASLFKRARVELSRMYPGEGYKSAASLEDLSEINLALVKRECEANIDPAEAKLFAERFDKLGFFWKHGTPVFDKVQKDEALSSLTRLDELIYAPAVVYEKNKANPFGKNPFHHAYVIDDDAPNGVSKQKISSTSVPQLQFRGDGGFVFFRFNIGDAPMPSSRFSDGKVQLVLDPDGDARLHNKGWVTLRDVYYPYTHASFATGKFAITYEGSQRFSTYRGVQHELVPNTAARWDRPLDPDEIETLGGRIRRRVETPAYNQRQVFTHNFCHTPENRSLREGRDIRREHVMEGAFHGTDIVPGVMHSAMRAMWELPPLWNEVVDQDLSVPGFERLMRIWLHKFFHIEAKYPWKLTLPSVSTVTEDVSLGLDNANLPVGIPFGTMGHKAFYPAEPAATLQASEVDPVDGPDQDPALGYPNEADVTPETDAALSY